MFCHKCGTNAIEEAIYCSKCGTKLGSPEINAKDNPTQPSARHMLDIDEAAQYIKLSKWTLYEKARKA